MLCNEINASYQQHWHLQINLFCLFPFHNEMLNNFLGNSPNSKMTFTLHKRTVRIIAGVKSRSSCRNLFTRLETLPLPYKYIFTLLNSVVSNQEHFQEKSAIHSVNTRNRDHLHRPSAKLICYQKIAYCAAGIKIFNNLPSNLRSLMNKQTQFKVVLKRYLNIHSFHSVEEILTSKNDS
jgi:IS1 family transposase